MLSSLSRAFSFSNIWTYALTEERFEHSSPFCRILKKPTGENVPKLLYTQGKASMKIEDQENETNKPIVQRPPLVGKSNAED